MFEGMRRVLRHLGAYGSFWAACLQKRWRMESQMAACRADASGDVDRARVTLARATACPSEQSRLVMWVPRQGVLATGHGSRED